MKDEVRLPCRHEMSLRPGPFAKIANGTKRYELRLYDEKRRQIRPGDEILFTRTTDGATVLVAVQALHAYRDFAELYGALPLTECGYTEENVGTADPKDMEAYYQPEKQKQYGVLAIEIGIVRLNVAKFGINGLQARELSEQDVPAMLRLALSNPMYYEYMQLQPDEQNLREAMTALPPRKTSADKYFFGWFDEFGSLVAVMDLITRHPDADTAFVGWFIVDASYQGRGIGSALISRALDCLNSAGFKHVWLGRIIGNSQSERFWRKCGFDDTEISYDTEKYTVAVMHQSIT